MSTCSLIDETNSKNNNNEKVGMKNFELLKVLGTGGMMYLLLFKGLNIYLKIITKSVWKSIFG